MIKWTVRQLRGSWWATIDKGTGAPVDKRVPVVLLHPKGDECGAMMNWRTRTYTALPNHHGAWWRTGGFDRAIAETGMVLLRHSLGHDERGIARGGGPKIEVVSVSDVESSDDQFTFRLRERLAEIAD